MRHITFNNEGIYPIAILTTTLRKDDIVKAYMEPWDVDKDSVMILELHTAPGKRKLLLKRCRSLLPKN